LRAEPPLVCAGVPARWRAPHFSLRYRGALGS
jgi:hypothetical protein